MNKSKLPSPIMPKQIELFEIKNPCIGLCQSNKRGYCFGCWRSRTERQLWHKMNNEQRREVIRLLTARKERTKQLTQRKGEQLGFEFESEALLLDFGDPIKKDE